MSTAMHSTGPSSQQWRGDAVAYVLEALYQRHPDLEHKFGTRGRNACRQDIYYHLDYLAGASVANDPNIFARYALWLEDVLIHRGVPSQHLVESFELVVDYCRAHLPETEAKLLSEIVTAGLKAMDRTNTPVPHAQDRLPALDETTPFRDAILGGDHRQASELVQFTMQAGCSLTEAAVRLIQPAMYDIGRLWQENRVSVAKEHMATAITQNVMAHAYLQAQFAPPTGSSAMFAAVAGNHHSVGLRMLSDALETAGWQTAYLGADVPTGALLREVDASRPDLLCLSMSLPIHLAAARETVAMLRAEMGSRCPTIWVGGQATLVGERIWNTLDADGWAYDALHAKEQLKV